MFECKPVVKQSKKTGTEYTCLEITFPNGYEKTVFLDKAEEFIAIQYLVNE